MKKILLYVFIACNLILASCASDSNPEIGRIKKSVKHFYDSGYDYTHTISSYENDKLISQEVIEGQVLLYPHREHMKRLTTSDKQTWDEIYYRKFDSYVVKDGKLQKVRLTVEKPCGYGKNLIFQEPRKSTDGKKVLAYDAQYIIHIGKSYGIEQKLDAVIKQEYLLDPKTDILLKITTDLSEQDRLNEIAVNMTANQMSYEEAVKAAEKAANRQHIEELSIYNYRNPTRFEMPKM